MPWHTPFTDHPTVKVGAVETHVAETGEGPPIVFLHGNPDTHAVWSSTVAKLTGMRCIAPDLPGFGATRAPEDFDFSLESQGEFVRGLVSALELDRFHLVVHDVGGPYGLAFASLHPARLQSLTIFNTIFSPDYRWHAWARVWRTRGLGELSLKILNRPLFVRELRRGSPTMPREYADFAYDEINDHSKRMVLRWYRAMNPEVWLGWDTRLRATTAQVPTQVLWGDLDPFIQPRFAEGFGGTVRHVSDRGHWLMVEHPEFAATEIGTFVSQHR